MSVTPTPDFSEARRRLRRARVLGALNRPTDGSAITRYRNRLLQVLGPESVNFDDEFDHLAEERVETIVSIALSAVDESADDAVAVILMCLHVLASDGQFARLALLSERLATLGRQFEVERPFWSTAVISFARALAGHERSARLALEERLGVTDSIVMTNRKTRDLQQISDILASAALRSLLVADSSPSFVKEVGSIALRNGDGALLSFLDAASAWRLATTKARPAMVLSEADHTFRKPELQNYIENLPIQTLFPAQIRAIAAGATLDTTRVVALPTSSGKTFIAEFRIVAALTRNPGTRAIYVAPYRLLARQVETHLAGRLSRFLGIQVRDLGSGYDPTAAVPSESADVIICTPERLDALMRLAGSDYEGSVEAKALFDACSVLVFDEMHLVGRPGRGPRFELIVARLRYMEPGLHILGLAAASHGSQELSDWLGDESKIATSRRPTGTLELVWETDGTIRQRVARTSGTTVAKLPRKNPLDDASNLILQLSSLYTPALAVCTGRRNAENLAKKLHASGLGRGTEWRMQLSQDQSTELSVAIEEIRSILGQEHPLATFMEGGIAFHHAGVPTHALAQIERLTKKGLLRAVAATTTVAEGADLPFKVVVIPHLNFPGRSRRLERDLYLNIIGRAGRANVSVEGLVFILDSDAPTIRNLVRGSLWSTVARDSLSGQLSEISSDPRNAEEWNDFLEVQSQVMAWLGDGSSYIDNQAEVLSALTFSYSEGNAPQQRIIRQLIDATLVDLHMSNFTVAGSPYKLTEIGRRARLSGLSTPSVRRLDAAVLRGKRGWLADIPNIVELNDFLALHVARLVFESIEVFQNGLWFKRKAKSDAAKYSEMARFCNERSTAHENDPDFQADLTLLSRWIMGDSYRKIAELAPPANTSQSLFGGSDSSKLVSDATEFIGRLSYPASWVWSAVQILSGDETAQFPPFIRGALEYGLPSESAVYLANASHMTRRGSLAVAQQSGPSRSALWDWIVADGSIESIDDQLTRADYGRLVNLRIAAEDGTVGK